MQEVEFSDIIVSYTDKNDNTNEVSFVGKWIVEQLRNHNSIYSVALTDDDKLFTICENDRTGISRTNRYDSFDEMREDNFPPELLAQVAEKVGEEYKEE